MKTYNKEIIAKAMKHLESNKEKLRNKAFNILLPISENNPAELYSEWGRFIKILKMDEVSNKYVAIPIIANLVKVDKENKFEKIFDDYYDLILHESPVVSPHVAGNSGKIINAKLHLQKKILNRLLTTDKKSLCRHKELLKSYVIDALDECFSKIENKAKVIQYVERQIGSESPKTKKRAKAFLDKHKTVL
jgi:DNA polymerase III epsilon subunit-like protein